MSDPVRGPDRVGQLLAEAYMRRPDAVDQEHALDRARRATDVDGSALAMRLAGKGFDGRSARRIQHRHGRKVDDIGFRALADAIEGGAHACRRAEEEGAGNAVDDD